MENIFFEWLLIQASVLRDPQYCGKGTAVYKAYASQPDEGAQWTWHIHMAQGDVFRTPNLNVMNH